MSPVFSHGMLRLYLLKLLDESPRHGYDVIRLLEDRFMGLYAPSPGTIYPRLQRLEAEGLVTQSQEGGRKVYRITEAGRQELRRRHDELDELETEIRSSVHGLARGIREEVRGTVRDLKQELKRAAREIRRQQRHENRSRRDWYGYGDDGWDADHDPHLAGRHDADAAAPRLERRLREFLAGAHQVVDRAHLTEAQLRECAAILDDTLERLRNVFRDRR
jgi:DNA-binding PadR family transcriptional regulator